RRGRDTIALHGKDVFRHRWSSPLELSRIQGPIDHKAGRAFYGGVAGPVFGHLITQSLGRLWAAPPDVPILFISVNPAFVELPKYFITLIRKLGLNNPIELITNHCRVDELIVAEDRFNLERPVRISPDYSDWLLQIRKDVPLQEDLFLYVSRAQLGPTSGQYLQEIALEDALRAQGYTVIYPESLPIEQQIDLYLRAKRLIFADGSAVHLWSLFASAQQIAAVICRRAPHVKMNRLLAAFERANPIFFDCRLAEFSGNKRGANSSVALLDMDQVWRRLRRRGFHSKRHLYFPLRASVMDWLATLQEGADPNRAPPFELDQTSRDLLAIRPAVTFSIPKRLVQPPP
ncbi:MAG: glycosyltransferase family 61 protein, partial [Cypionkella sp.]|nr:glycosyltransferase family 61 protein [Cypionkella sp.]